MQPPRSGLLTLLLILVCAPSLQSQIGMSNPVRDINRAPQFSYADIHSINRVLGITEDQQAVIMEVYEAHMRNFTSELNELLIDLEDARDEAIATNHTRPLVAARSKAERWQDRSRELDEQFLSDLRLLLTHEQEALWPRVERELRRIRLTPKGVFAGESTDLVRLLDTVHPQWNEQPNLRSTIDAYITAMDAALTERERVRESASKDIVWGGDQTQRERMKQAYEDIRRARIRVRSINEEHLRRLLTALPSGSSARLELTFYESAIGPARATTPLDRRIRAVGTLPDLTPEQAAAAQAAINKLDHARMDFLKSTYSAYADLQNTEFPISLTRYFDGEEAYVSSLDFENIDEQNPVRRAMQNRFDFEREIYQDLRPLLTREQRALLPAPDDQTIWFNWPVPDFR